MEENGIVKASLFKSHYEAAQQMPVEERCAFYDAIFAYQFSGEISGDLPPAIKWIMTAILPVLDKEVEAKAGRPECEISSEEIAAKKEELGSAKAVADFYGISERTVYRKLSELPKTPASVTDSHCQTLTTAKTDKTKEERRMKNEEGENEEREKEGVGAQSASVAAEPPAPSPSPNCVLFPQAPSSPPKQKRFIPPTVEEVAAYCKERGNGIDAESFVAFYESKGWLIGKNKMKDWRQAVITWEKRDAERKAAEARASPQPIYQHWEAPERPELSDEEREQMCAVLRGTIKGLARRKTAQLGGAR